MEQGDGNGAQRPVRTREAGGGENRHRRAVERRLGALPALGQAFQSLDRKGTLLLFAIPETDIQLPTVDFWRNEMTVTSSYGAAPDDLVNAIELIASGKVNMKDLITHKLPLEKAQEGFRLVAEAKNSLKVILLP